MLDETRADAMKYFRKIPSGIKIAGVIKSLGNTRILQQTCTKWLHVLIHWN